MGPENAIRQVQPPANASNQATLLHTLLDFRCRFERPALFSAFSGSMLRGAFGRSLKEVTCVLRYSGCRSCRLDPPCLYALLFDNGVRKRALGDARGLCPPPFVLRPPHGESGQVRPGQEISFSLGLFGEAAENLPLFCWAVRRMGELGLGSRVDGHRGTFKLTQVSQDGQTVWDPQDEAFKFRPACRLVWERQEDQDGAEALHIILKTPLRTQDGGRLARGLSFPLLVRTALRRVQSLFEVHGKGTPSFPWQDLLTRAEEVEALQGRLQWQDWTRYSSRQGCRMKLGGLIGSLAYRGPVSPFLPLLKLASPMHIGKQTSFGFGQFDYLCAHGTSEAA